jgi:hypothetical protein
MEEYIFRFDISVYDIAIMHKLDCMTDLLDNTFDPFLWKPALTLQIVVDVSATAKL